MTALWWGAEGENLLLAFGELVAVAKSAISGKREAGAGQGGEAHDEVEMNTWKAHEGGVTAADWASTGARLILSAGWDGRCCIWSPKGLLVRCIAVEHLCSSPRPWLANLSAESRQLLPLIDAKKRKCPTAVSWKPSGDMFILAVDKALLLCNIEGELLSSVPLPHGGCTDTIAP